MSKQFKKTKNRAVFLDRDGVINKNPKEHDYVKNWGEFEFLPGAADAIKKLNKNFLVVVVSNQRGLARKTFSLKNLEDIHNKMKEKLGRVGAKIDAIYFCPHDFRDNCRCRKPKPGMIFKAAKDFNIDLEQSYMIGDRPEDIEAGIAAGCKTVFLGDNKKVKPDFFAKNISDTLKIIES